MTTVNKQQKEIEHQVYKQELKRREVADDEDGGGLFASYTDPSRNIAVGDAKAELSLKHSSGNKGKILLKERINFSIFFVLHLKLKRWWTLKCVIAKLFTFSRRVTTAALSSS